MGLGPEAIGAMSMFQLSAYVAGWNASQGAGKPEAPTDDEFDAMLIASAERDMRGCG